MLRPLRYHAYWLAIGWGIVLVIITASLYPHPPVGLLENGWDKVWHASAYALLMFWFSLLYLRFKTRVTIALACITLGFLIEVAQGFSIIRSFDLNDAVANSVGVAFGAASIRTPLARILLWIEYNLTREK